MNEITVKLPYHGAQNVDSIMHEVRKQIEKHNREGYQNVEDLIELSIKTKTLITLVENQYRGFGKSTVLAKKAKELGATLVIPRHMKPYYSDFIPYANVKYYVSPQQARGIRLDGGFLVDEGVDSEVIKELSRNNEFLGGFHRL